MKIFFIVVLSIAAGITAGLFAFKYVSGYLPSSLFAVCSEKYELLNPQLDCETKQVIRKTEYTSLQLNVEKYIKDLIELKKVTSVSVYYRDLVQGPTFGIDEYNVFVPASLLKLPLLITYLNIADEDKKILTRKASYSAVNNEVTQERDIEQQIKPKTLYAISELLSRMIVYSDNLSYGLLVKSLEKAYPNKNLYINTLKELGLVNPENTSESNFTVKSYSSLFRQLYNASYLSPKMSDYALQLLTKSTYKDGLVAGVPNTVKIAHKYGEREGLENGETQLHDCGIVYYPQNPYVLCVMSRGSDSAQLSNILKTISKKVYDEVNSRRIQ